MGRLAAQQVDEFWLEIAQLAGMHGLKVTFADPAMEQMRRETGDHKEMETSDKADTRKISHRHGGKDGQSAGMEI